MKTKKIIVYIAVFILLGGFFQMNKSMSVYADDMTVTIGLSPSGDLKVGDTVTATVMINGENLSSYSINLNYTTGILQYDSEAGDTGSIAISGTGSTTISYIFTAVGEGRASISTSGNEAIDADGNYVNISHAGANVIVGNVQTDEDTIKIGNDTYTFVNEYRLPKAPEGYKESYVDYKDRQIYAYQAPNQNIKVVALQNQDGDQKWFVYDEEKDEFSPFAEHSLDGQVYVIINKPDNVPLPDGFSENSLSLEKTQFTAYTDGSDSGLYLIYAVNPKGEAGLYYYDTNEGSFTSYDVVKSIVDYATANSAYKAVNDGIKNDSNEKEEEKKYATPLIPEENSEAEEEEGLLSSKTLKNLLVMMIVLFIIMCVVVIILVIRNGMLQNQLDMEDDDEDYDDMENDEEAESVLDSLEEIKPSSPGKNKRYNVNEDTGEILIEVAEDNNSGSHVPPAEDKIVESKIENAMKEIPFGIDSAFSVAPPDEAVEGDNVYKEPVAKGDVIDDQTVERIRKEKSEALAEEQRKAADRAARAKLAEQKAFVDLDQSDDHEKTVFADQKEEKSSKKEEKIDDERKKALDEFFSVDIEEEERQRKNNRKNKKNRRKNKKKSEEMAPDSEIKNEPSQVDVSEKSETSIDSDDKKNKPQKIALPGEMGEEEE